MCYYNAINYKTVMTSTATFSKSPIATFQAVKAAADALAADGVEPSVRTVTIRIGGGSPNTVSMLLRRWREEKPSVEARKAIVLDDRIGIILSEQISGAVVEATRHATAERDARADDLAAVSQRSTELETDLETASTRIGILEERAQREAGKIEALQSELESTKVAATEAVKKAQVDAAVLVSTAQGEAATERQKLDEMARQLGAAQEKGLEADRLRQALKEATALRENEHQGRIDAEKQLAVSQAQAKESASQVTVLAKRMDVQDADLIMLREKLAVKDAQSAAYENDAMRLKNALAEITPLRDSDHQGRVDAEMKLAVAQAQIKESSGQIAALTKRLESLDGQLLSVREKLTEAEIHAASAQATAAERALQILSFQDQVKDATVTPSEKESKAE